MKKLWRMAILVTMIFVFLLGTCALTESARNPLAIDMVIVIENSVRMNKASDNSRTLDKNGLRFDAAAALISMCDAKYSRANYFLFNRDLFVYSETTTGNVKEVTPNDIALFDISLPVHKPQRQRIMEILNGDKIRNGYGTKAGADIGKAFAAAVEVQTREQGNGNRKVILLLTAGNNSLDESSIAMAKDAKKTADENGIEVYAVALSETSSAQFLQELVSSPDNYQFANSPEDLVDVYRNFFAAMIGSDPMESKSIRSEEDGKSRIELSIPNDSVAEVNIIIPLTKVDDLALVGPDGRTITKTEDNVFVSSSTNFISYKLISPQSDTYVLSYSSADEKNIVVQYVFSYGVQVQAEVSAKTVNKHEPVTISARYIEDGIPTKDGKLYNIPAKLTLRKNGRVISQSDMEHDDSRYYLTIHDLDAVGIGEYTADIHFEGDGLKRDSETVSFELINNPPELVSAAVTGDSYDVTINVPRNQDSYLPAKNEKTWDLNTFIKDINGDVLKGEIISNTADVDAVVDGMTLHIQPRKDKATEGEIRILVKDSEGSVSPELIFPVKVNNFEEKYDTYTARFDPVKGIEKNSVCDLTLRIYNASGDEVRQDDQVPDTIIATVQEGDNQPQDVTLTREGAHWIGSFPTGNQATEYVVAAKISVGQKTIVAENATISSENKAPSLKTGAKAQHSWTIDINDPSDPESYKIQQHVWNLGDLVEDLNGDQITFTVNQDASTAQVSPSINPADQTLTVATRLNTETDGDVVVNCKDNDSVEGPILTFHIKVTSKEEKYKLYTAKLETDGHGKSRETKVTLSVRDEKGLLVTGDSNLPNEFDMTYTDKEINKQYSLPMTRGKDGQWTGSFTTKDKETEYVLSAAVQVSDNIKITAPDFILNTKNTPPAVVKELNTTEFIPSVFNVEPFLLWKDATADVVIPDLNDYFTDADGDTLRFSVSSKFSEDQAIAELEGSKLTIRGIGETPGDISFTVIATDNEGLTAESQPVSFSVKSLKKQGIITLAIIAAAIIALLIIRQATKPSFHSQYFEVSTKKTGAEPLSQGRSINLKGKKPVKLGNFSTAGARQACGNEIPTQTLNKVTIAPAYGGCIKIRIEEMGNVSVRTGATKLSPKKGGTISPDGVLTVENNGQEVLFQLKKAGPPASGPITPANTPKPNVPTPAAGTPKRTSRT